MANRSPDLFDRAWRALCAAFEAPIRGPDRTDLAGGAFLLTLVGLLVSSRVLYVQDLPLDLFVQLDGAWRWMSGQRPHVDFYTPVGDLWYLLLGLAGTLCDGDPMLVVYASVLLAPFVAVGAFVATDRRLPSLPRVLLALAITCCALSPRTLDTSLISGVATYNRYGWAFVGIVAAALLLEPVGQRRTWPTVAVVTAAILAIFWMKATYLGVAGAAVLLSVVCVPANRPVAVPSALFAGLGGLVSALSPQGRMYLADLARAAEAASGGPGLLRLERLAPEVRTNMLELVSVVVVGLMVMRTSRDAAEERTGTRVAAAAAGLTFASVAVTVQSHDRWIPVLVIAVAVAFAGLRARSPDRSRLPVQLAGAMLCGLLGLGLALDTVAISVLAFRQRIGPTLPLASCPPSTATCIGERIRVPMGAPDSGKIELVRTGEIPGYVYDNLKSVPWNVDDAPILEDALGLLARQGLEHEKIASLTFSPSFPWLLGSPPPRHLPSWWDWQRTMGPEDEARMSTLLSDSDVVLVPKVWQVIGLSIARGTLETEFEVRDATPLWTVWVRR